MEFLEQFNENILIKAQAKPLKIHNALTSKNTYIKDFETPEAFIFVYEKEMFMALNRGFIKQYQVHDGIIKSDFEQEQLYTDRQIENLNP